MEEENKSSVIKGAVKGGLVGGAVLAAAGATTAVVANAMGADETVLDTIIDGARNLIPDGAATAEVATSAAAESTTTAAENAAEVSTEASIPPPVVNPAPAAEAIINGDVPADGTDAKATMAAQAAKYATAGAVAGGLGGGVSGAVVNARKASHTERQLARRSAGQFGQAI